MYSKYTYYMAKDPQIYDIIHGLQEKEGIPARGARAVLWFRKRIQEMYKPGDILQRDILDDKSRQVGKFFRRPMIGKMYMFRYAPKTRVDLDYYDTFPLIFLLKVNRNRILGINIHYMPYILRSRLFIRLLTVKKNNNRFDRTTRLKISYEILKKSARLNKLTMPLIRQYDRKRIRSRLIEIPSQDWNLAAFLPMEAFKKTGRQDIWAQTRRKINE